jgi:hypothetical protein
MRISWPEFEEYAKEFLCEHCELKEPSHKNDKCVEKCLKDWINRQFEKDAEHKKR